MTHLAVTNRLCAYLNRIGDARELVDAPLHNGKCTGADDILYNAMRDQQAWVHGERLPGR